MERRASSPVELGKEFPAHKISRTLSDDRNACRKVINIASPEAKISAPNATIVFTSGWITDCPLRACQANSSTEPK